MQSADNSSEFIQRVRSHQDILHKVCFVYGRVPADRDDLAQDILLQLWKSYGSFDGRSSFSTWMYRVALNTAITFRRKHKRPAQARPELAAEGTQLASIELTDDLGALYRAIAQLSDIEKAIIMQWLDERSYRDIADTVGISEKNVSVRLVRIRERLARLVRETERP